MRRVRSPRYMHLLNKWLRSRSLRRLPSPHPLPCLVLLSFHCTASAVSALAHGSDAPQTGGLAAVRLAPHDPHSVRASYAAILVSFASSPFPVRRLVFFHT